MTEVGNKVEEAYLDYHYIAVWVSAPDPVGGHGICERAYKNQTQTLTLALKRKTQLSGAGSHSQSHTHWRVWLVADCRFWHPRHRLSHESLTAFFVSSMTLTEQWSLSVDRGVVQKLAYSAGLWVFISVTLTVTSLTPLSASKPRPRSRPRSFFYLCLLVLSS